MYLYYLRYSTLCLISVLGLMSYETAAYGDASLLIDFKLPNDKLSLTKVIFRPDYDVPIENNYDTQFYILPGTYPEIKITARFKNEPVESFPCSPTNVTVKEGDYLFLTVTSFPNKPDKPICTLRIQGQP